jgi:hypothetical protein
LRPWIGQWAERNRSILSVTDRGSILLIVYAAFSRLRKNAPCERKPSFRPQRSGEPESINL